MDETVSQSSDARGPWACVACGGGQRTELLPARAFPTLVGGSRQTFSARVVRCTNCGLAAMDPMPDPEVIAGFYSAAYSCYQPYEPALGIRGAARKLSFAKGRFEPDGGVRSGLARVAARATELASGKTISYSLAVPPTLPHDARILEIGFGSGTWLRSMHALGYSALAGYDIAANQAYVDELRALGVAVSSGRFLDNDYGKGAWECIRLEHVLEHVDDPLPMLARCRELLTETGVLVMTLPCVDSLSTTVSFEHSPTASELPFHLYHHTASSVGHLLRRAGFAHFDVRVFADAASITSTVVGRFALPRRSRALSALRMACAPLYAAYARRRRNGELLTVVAGNLERVRLS